MLRSRRFQVLSTVTLLIGCSFPHYDFRGEHIEAEGGVGASGSGVSGATSTRASSSGSGAIGSSVNVGGTGAGSGGYAAGETATLAGAGFAGWSSNAPSGGATWTEVSTESGGQSAGQGGDATGEIGGTNSPAGGYGGATTNASAGTGNAVPTSEICGNAIDDDVDGRMDCDDTECSDTKCRANIPTGWEGPVVTVTAANLSNLPSCDAAGSYTIPAGILCSQVSKAPANCSTCPECPMVSDVAVTFSVSVSTMGCHVPATTNPNDSNFSLSTTCSNIFIEKTKFASGSRPFYMNATNATFSGGKCDPDVIHRDLDPSTEAACLQYTRICEGPRPVGSCRNGGGSCMQNSTGGSSGELCIYADGVQACPNGWGGLQQIVENVNLDDKRSCADCICSPPAATTGTLATLQNWGSNLSCSGSGYEGSARFGTCLPTSDFDISGNFNVWVAAPDATPPEQRCVQGGGGSMGSIVSSRSYTICCL